MMHNAERPGSGEQMSTTTAAQDIAALTALNQDYIASVQRGDVRRFEEILAADFLCSNPDGTLIDRAQFLAQTARPVTITGLVAEDVQIRLFGDLALIHARTFMLARAIAPRTAKNGRAAIPMPGRVATANGWRSPRM